jgi:hypothetical protein
VFLGLDHSYVDHRKPILFETALIPGEKRYCEWRKKEVRDVEVVQRYATWAEAEEGHIAWIEKCVPKEMIEATVKANDAI